MRTKPRPSSFVHPVAHCAVAVLNALFLSLATAHYFGAPVVFSYLAAFAAASATAAYCLVGLHRSEEERLERYDRRAARRRSSGPKRRRQRR